MQPCFAQCNDRGEVRRTFLILEDHFSGLFERKLLFLGHGGADRTENISCFFAEVVTRSTLILRPVSQRQWLSAFPSFLVFRFRQ